MYRRVVRLGVVIAATVGLVLGTAGIASAAPINFPSGQTATKVGGGWECVNGGNTSK